MKSFRNTFAAGFEINLCPNVSYPRHNYLFNRRLLSGRIAHAEIDDGSRGESDVVPLPRVLSSSLCPSIFASISKIYANYLVKGLRFYVSSDTADRLSIRWLVRSNRERERERMDSFLGKFLGEPTSLHYWQPEKKDWKWSMKISFQIRVGTNRWRYCCLEKGCQEYLAILINTRVVFCSLFQAWMLLCMQYTFKVNSMVLLISKYKGHQF